MGVGWGVHKLHMGLCRSNNAPRFESRFPRPGLRTAGQVKGSGVSQPRTSCPSLEPRGQRRGAPSLSARAMGITQPRPTQAGCPARSAQRTNRNLLERDAPGARSTRKLPATPLCWFGSRPPLPPALASQRASAARPGLARCSAALSLRPTPPAIRHSQRRLLCNCEEGRRGDPPSEAGFFGGLPPERSPPPPAPRPRPSGLFPGSRRDV